MIYHLAFLSTIFPQIINGFSPSSRLPQLLSSSTNTNTHHSKNPSLLPLNRKKTNTFPLHQAVSSSTEFLANDAVIVGGGPAGLLCAIMLAQKGPNYQVEVFDRLDPPPSPTDEEIWSDVAKFYLLGLGGRGQRALDKFDVWYDVEEVCTAVNGRKDWSPESGSEEGVERIYKDRPYTTQVLPRDKLVGVLHKYIEDNLSDQIDLNYNWDVTPLDFNGGHNEEEGPVVLSVNKCSSDVERVNPTSVGRVPADESTDEACDAEKSFIMSTNLLIAADGTSRTVANVMESIDKEQYESKNIFQKIVSPKPFKVTRYVDDNQRIYKTIPFQIPKDWRPDLNYSARSKDGRVTFDALPADDKGNYCGVLLLRKNDELSKADSDPKKLRELLDDNLPQFSSLVDEDTLLSVAKKPPSFLPGFRYAGPRLHQDKSTLILGDCAHTVKPYFGLGANSALEDVSILSDILDSTSSTEEAVKEFTNQRAKESEALVKLSRELDRPGILGFFTFILPLILDSIFNKINPKLFAPNIIAMLQREKVGFAEVRLRKRMDRLLQMVCIGGVLKGMLVLTKGVIKGVAAATGKTQTTAASVMVGMMSFAYILKKSKFFFNSDLAPADVLNKTKSKVSDNETFITGMATSAKGSK